MFSVPVYAVWGNYEDVQVLRQLNTNLNVENLHVLDEHHFYQFYTSENELEFSLYGLGGNFLVSKKWCFVGTRIIEKIWNYQQDQFYVSQRKILKLSIETFPITLTESQYVEISIDLIDTINAFKGHCDFLDRKNYIWRMFYSLAIDVVCTHKTYKLKPHREIWHYMLSQYRSIFQ
jgi:hypothetical protein